MKFVRSFIEQSIASDERLVIEESEKVVAVRVKNQGTATVYTGWGSSETATNQIPSGGADLFDAGDSGIIEDTLKISFGSTGTRNVVVLKLKDKREIC